MLLNMAIKNRKFNVSFRNKTKNKNDKILIINKLSSCQGQKSRITKNNPILAYPASALDTLQKYNSLQQPVIFESNLRQQIPPKYYDPCDKLRFGNQCINFLKHGTISAKFITSVRLNIARKLKKTSRFWIRLSATTPVTARSAETRMGRGKGAIAFWQSRVKPGQTFVEFSKLNPRTLELIFNDLKKKTPVPLVMKH